MFIIDFNNRSGVTLPMDLYDSIVASLERVAIMENVLTECEVSYSFVTPDEIHSLNREYRNKDAQTDVLSFPMLSFPEDKAMLVYDTGIPVILGDIVVSVEQAVKQAEEYGNTLEREICYLSVHSALHLLGYDHMVDDEKSEMRIKEKQIMGDID